MKWQEEDFRYPFRQWTCPSLVYPTDATEANALRGLKSAFEPLARYPLMEQDAIAHQDLVDVEVCMPSGAYAFLENNAERCISPQTKHSQEGMQGARHWVQRVGTQEAIFKRLLDGYGISLMYGERCYQYIRNSQTWRGVSGCMLDIDVFRDDAHPNAPEPVWSMDELLSRYPILTELCSFIMPSASSLYDGRPFKARACILYPEPITDQRVHRSFGDILLKHLDCIPANVTKNPVAVAFGNTHNAHAAWINNSADTDSIAEKIAVAKSQVLSEAEARQEQQAKQKATQQRYASNIQGCGETDGEPISTFIQECDAVSELQREGLLVHENGDQYRWHTSDTPRSCLVENGVIKIFSNTMQGASPEPSDPKVNAHRFLLYCISGLDMTKDSDKAKAREFLSERGYGTSSVEWLKTQNGIEKRGRKPKLEVAKSQVDSETLDANETARHAAIETFGTESTERTQMYLISDATGSGKTHTILAKSQQTDNRTLAVLPFTEQAQQAIEMAWDTGFKTPLHLKGRETGWEKSGISNIPIALRTADMFDLCGCVMNDEVSEYQKRRVAGRVYCEHICDFRDECVKRGHLSQYRYAADADFIATCSPNLLFDPQFKNYLKMLITLNPEPETEEEQIIGAALGLEQGDSDTQIFENAYVDDYTVAGLYNDVNVSLEEVQKLRGAWIDTPLGDFANEVLHVFLETENTAIFNRLKNAVDALTAEKKEVANSQLTTIGRRGTIHALTKPKGSKESKRLLSDHVIIFDDGGRLFIPVDDDAYSELKSKRVPVVELDLMPDTWTTGDRATIATDILTAIFRSIPLNCWTPVWLPHWTLIDWIDTLIATTGTPENAPVNVSDCVLTLSLPPQDSGLLKNIAMLSPKDESEAVKQVFTGQNIDFHIHTGKPIDFADDVRVYQLSDYRITSASVLEYPETTDGKRNLRETPVALKPKTLKRFEKANAFAKQTIGLAVFISYKDIADNFQDTLPYFDVITHFDKMAGLNLEGLELLIVYGYPKVKHEVVMDHARVQYASNTSPLPTGTYEELTEEKAFVENGITITERRYTDTRIDTIRKQLATDKLNQAVGRARHPRWKSTTTIVFTNAPIPTLTERATLFTDAAFNAAEHCRDFETAQQRIDDALAKGDVKQVAKSQGVSERTARRKTADARKLNKADRDAEIFRRFDAGETQQDISDALIAEGYKASLRTVKNVLNARTDNSAETDTRE